jgi:hypothetical protein
MKLHHLAAGIVSTVCGPPEGKLPVDPTRVEGAVVR